MPCEKNMTEAQRFLALWFNTAQNASPKRPYDANCSDLAYEQTKEMVFVFNATSLLWRQKACCNTKGELSIIRATGPKQETHMRTYNCTQAKSSVHLLLYISLYLWIWIFEFLHQQNAHLILGRIMMVALAMRRRRVGGCDASVKS